MTPISRLQTVLRLQTMSGADMSAGGPFARFRALLPQMYPAIWRDGEVVTNGHSVLVRVPGTGADAPVGFVGHYDVVPPGAQRWTHGPFDGDIADGEIWGRGAMDDKGRLLAVLEAVEWMLDKGDRPRRDLYLLIDHDEESAGTGARDLGAQLSARSVRLAALFDEGEGIIEDAIPGVVAPIAMIGIAEKGYVDVLLSVHETAGHSSTPPRSPATVRLARAVTRVHRARRPPRLTAAVRGLLVAVEAHSSPRQRLFYRLARLMPAVGARILHTHVPELAPALETTFAVTQLTGSEARNTLASVARATVNVRPLPGDDIAAVRRRVVAAIGDPEVIVELDHACEASEVSPAAGAVWEAMTTALAASHPDALPVPFVLPGATDSRHLADRADVIYRFMPLRVRPDQRGGLHGPNERITIVEWERTIAFYRGLIARL